MFFLSLVTLIPNLSNAAALSLADLDFSRIIESDGIIYAPITGTTINDGAFWYREYDQEVLSPTQYGTLRSLIVRMYPMSHKNGLYEAFLTGNNLKDTRLHLLPDDAILCEPNNLLKDKIASLSLPHNFTTMPGGYPNLCSLQILYNYQAGSIEEQNFLTFLNENQVVKVAFNITADVPVLVNEVNVPEIINTLITQQALASGPNDTLQGDFLQIVYRSLGFPTELYGLNSSEKISYDNWLLFISLFSIAVDGGQASITNAAAAAKIPVGDEPNVGEVIFSVLVQ